MILDNLNEKQREAASQLEGPLLILAGAGSGKTSTMTHRIAYMLEQGISPWNILAVTFTNKAAREMRSRVDELKPGVSDLWIMTFHAMCLRILKVNCEKLGYKNNFTIYDGTDQKTLIKNIIKEKNINDKEFGVPYVISIISNSKERAQGAEEYKEIVEENYKTKIIYEIFKEYDKTLKKNNAMDFDDLLLNTVKLFEQNEDVLYRYQERFKYIMVDEYQDTNHLQYRMIKMLADEHHNLCVVGDDDQCIYQWRGADIRNILDFEKDFPETKTIKLEQNYRSVSNILAAAHSVIQNNKGRKSKKLWTEKEAGSKIKYHRADTEKDEAIFVAQEIDILKTKDRKYSDFAILYRTNVQSRHFENALMRRGIPYVVLSGLRYFDRKETKDMISYMRLVTNPNDDLALQRIINEPKRGMGAKSVEKLVAFANVRGESLLSALSDEEVMLSMPNKAQPGLRDLVQCINLCRQEKENLRVSDIYQNLMVKSGYLKALEDANTIEAEGRIRNIMDFKSVIFDYEDECSESEAEPTLEEFMEKITLMAEVDKKNDSDDAVVLMTMHSAKGLEFPIVFIPGMEDGLFPGNRAFDSVSGMEEERRLCYVGMTRAKELLLLTSAQVRTLYGRTDYTRESQFLRELDKKLVDGDAIYERKSRDSSLGVSTGSFDGYAASESISPYDALKKARMETKASVNGGDSNFEIGDHVTHGKFGAGLVVETDQKTVSVIFDSVGLKRLAKGVAPIKKV